MHPTPSKEYRSHRVHLMSYCIVKYMCHRHSQDFSNLNMIW